MALSVHFLPRNPSDGFLGRNLSGGFLLLLAGCAVDFSQPWLNDPQLVARAREVERERTIAGWIDRLPSPDAHAWLVAAGSEAEAPLLTAATYGEAARVTAALEVLEARRTRKLARILVGRWHKMLDPRGRAAVADAFGRLGDRSVVADLAHFLDSDTTLLVRARLARTLGVLADSRAVDALGRAALDPSPLLSIEAVKALSSLGTPRAVAPLLAALERAGQDETLAVTAIAALGRMGSTAALDLLVNRLKGSTSRAVRQACAGALGSIGDARAVPALIDALTDPAWSVFRECEDALKKITGANPILPPGEDLQIRTRKAWRERLRKK